MCSVCVHGVYVKEVRLHSPLLAELQFVDCVSSAVLAWAEKFQVAKDNCSGTNHPHLPTCKVKADGPGKWWRNQDSLHVLYASQAGL